MNALARVVVLGLFPVIWLAAGCTSQGEGERCSQNADCQSEFVCFFISSNVASNVGVCCSAGSTVAACNPGVTIDSGIVEMDAASEAAVEAASSEEASAEGGD